VRSNFDRVRKEVLDEKKFTNPKKRKRVEELLESLAVVKWGYSGPLEERSLCDAFGRRTEVEHETNDDAEMIADSPAPAEPSVEEPTTAAMATSEAEAIQEQEREREREQEQEQEREQGDKTCTMPCSGFAIVHNVSEGAPRFTCPQCAAVNEYSAVPPVPPARKQQQQERDDNANAATVLCGNLCGFSGDTAAVASHEAADCAQRSMFEPIQLGQAAHEASSLDVLEGLAAAVVAAAEAVVDGLAVAGAVEAVVAVVEAVDVVVEAVEAAVARAPTPNHIEDGGGSSESRIVKPDPKHEVASATPVAVAGGEVEVAAEARVQTEVKAAAVLGPACKRCRLGRSCCRHPGDPGHLATSRKVAARGARWVQQAVTHPGVVRRRDRREVGVDRPDRAASTGRIDRATGRGRTTLGDEPAEAAEVLARADEGEPAPAAAAAAEAAQPALAEEPFVQQGVYDAMVRARPGWLRVLSLFHSKSVCMALLYGCAGRLTSKNGGFRPGQMLNGYGEVISILSKGAYRL
jgi:hypothetical protein